MADDLRVAVRRAPVVDEARDIAAAVRVARGRAPVPRPPQVVQGLFEKRFKRLLSGWSRRWRAVIPIACWSSTATASPSAEGHDLAQHRVVDGRLPAVRGSRPERGDPHHSEILAADEPRVGPIGRRVSLRIHTEPRDRSADQQARHGPRSG